MGPDHGTMLTALPLRTQLLELYRTGKIAPTHTHQALTTKRKVSESGQDRSKPLHQDDRTRTALVSRWRPSGTEAGAAYGHRGMLLPLVFLLFQPQTQQ